MITEVLSGTLFAAMALTAPWQLNALFFMWLIAALIRHRDSVKKAEEIALAQTSADRDCNVSELNAYRQKARQEAEQGQQAQRAQ